MYKYPLYQKRNIGYTYQTTIIDLNGTLTVADFKLGPEIITQR
jgi:hypothetical protein